MGLMLQAYTCVVCGHMAPSEIVEECIICEGMVCVDCIADDMCLPCAEEMLSGKIWRYFRWGWERLRGEFPQIVEHCKQNIGIANFFEELWDMEQMFRDYEENKNKHESKPENESPIVGGVVWL